MMFKTFIAADDYNWRANVQNDRHVFLPTNKTFEGTCLAISGTQDYPITPVNFTSLRTSLHGGGGPQVSDVTCLSGVKKKNNPRLHAILGRGALSQDY